MERLDQDHLHPKLEVLTLICLGPESNPGLLGVRQLASTIAKSFPNSMLIAIRNIYI
jgi:hypothetical protein